MTSAALVWAALERRFGAGGAALVLFLILMLVVWAGNSAWNFAAKRYWRGEAEVATAAALTAQGNATSADAGARNASRTHASMGAATSDIHLAAEAAAARVEAHEDRPFDPADRSPLDADGMRELEAAQHRAGAAADRLRRTR